MVERHLGRVVIVTGGAKGIGRGIVERFIGDGANVLIADIDSEAGNELAIKLGENAVSIACDVRDEDQLKIVLKKAVDTFGQLDIMVNNVGYAMRSPIVETDIDAWRSIVDTNLTGVFLGTKLAAQQMIRQGFGGCIVNASSGGGRQGVANVAHYCATKAAIIVFSQGAALEFAKHKIRVNCYTPGHIETPMMNNLLETIAEDESISGNEAYEMLKNTVPWGRWGRPEDVANAVSWHCSAEAEYITGQCFAMNGGQLPW